MTETPRCDECYGKAVSTLRRWGGRWLCEQCFKDEAGLYPPHRQMELPLSTARAEFERCWPWLEASLEFGAFKHGGKIWVSHTKEDVWGRIVSGRCHFWPASESALITEFFTAPTGLKSHHNWLFGGDLSEIVSRMPAVEEFGRKHGAHRETGSGRRGWLRVFDGYKEIGVRKEKALI